MEKIDDFRGDYMFLSNFFEAPVTINGIKFRNNEAAFQAQKWPSHANEFANLTASEAKSLGRRVMLRPDWEQVKDVLMYRIVYAKFAQNSALRERLLKTGDTELVEGNTWGDRYWGVVDGYGENTLGKILMEVRGELRKKYSTHEEPLRSAFLTLFFGNGPGVSITLEKEQVKAICDVAGISINCSEELLDG